MFGLRKQKKERSSKRNKDPVYVDMENFDIKGDKSVVKVRVFIVKEADNIADIKAYLGSGDILVVDLTEIRESERGDMTDEIHRLSNASGYDFHRSSDHLMVLSSKGVSVKKMVQE